MRTFVARVPQVTLTQGCGFVPAPAGTWNGQPATLIWLSAVATACPTTIVDWPLFSTMPDVVRGEAGPSQIWTRFCSVVCRRMCATGGLGSTAADGTVPVSHKPPLQIGLLASPSSNSTQTLACGGGTM